MTKTFEDPFFDKFNFAWMQNTGHMAYSSHQGPPSEKSFIRGMVSESDLSLGTWHLSTLVSEGFCNEKGLMVKNDGSEEFRSFFKKSVKALKDEVESQHRKILLDIEEEEKSLT